MFKSPIIEKFNLKKMGHILNTNMLSEKSSKRVKLTGEMTEIIRMMIYSAKIS